MSLRPHLPCTRIISCSSECLLDQAPQRKRPADAGLLDVSSASASIFGDDGTAPAIVDTNGNQIDILADAVGSEEHIGGIHKCRQLVAHEQMIVLKGSRPVRREADFDAGADRAAPTGLIARRRSR